MTKEEKQALVPVWEKTLLTIDEASAYTGSGSTACAGSRMSTDAN